MGCFPSSDFSKKPPAHLFLLEALILSVGPFYPAASGPFFPARIGPFCPALIGPFNPALTPHQEKGAFFNNMSKDIITFKPSVRYEHCLGISLIPINHIA